MLPAGITVILVVLALIVSLYWNWTISEKLEALERSLDRDFEEVKTSLGQRATTTSHQDLASRVKAVEAAVFPPPVRQPGR